MKILKKHNVKLPTYSLPYLINGDDSGLSSEDKTDIDVFMNKFYQDFKPVNCDAIIDYDSESESYFTWSPAFGLACDVFDCTILILG
jgi:hypothetical protein